MKKYIALFVLAAIFLAGVLGFVGVVIGYPLGISQILATIGAIFGIILSAVGTAFLYVLNRI